MELMQKDIERFLQAVQEINDAADGEAGLWSAPTEETPLEANSGRTQRVKAISQTREKPHHAPILGATPEDLSELAVDPKILRRKVS